MAAPASGFWNGRTVLVTGAAGFLGGHVVRRLVADGASTVALSRPGGTPLRLAAVGTPGTGRLRHVECDLGDAAAFGSLVRDLHPDLVFHLGGRVSGAPLPELVAPTFATLVGSSIALLSAAQEGHVGRVVLIASSDEMSTGSPPASPYAAAKATTAAYGRLFSQVFGTSVVTVRPTEVFGPGQAPAKLLPYVAESVAQGLRPLLSSGRRRGDWVYVSDVVEGMVVAAERAPDGSEVDLGTGVLRSNREMVESLLRHMGSDIEPEWGALPDRPAETEHPADTAAAEALLGWRALVPVDDGLRRLAGSFAPAAVAG